MIKLAEDPEYGRHPRIRSEDNDQRGRNLASVELGKLAKREEGSKAHPVFYLNGVPEIANALETQNALLRQILAALAADSKE
jgi:hypothetical protein